MPGPNSAPNGDRALVHGVRDLCPVHGRSFSKCYGSTDTKHAACKKLVTLREYKALRGRLISGKTAAKHK